MVFSLRPVIQHDYPYLLDIDCKCFDHPWTPEVWEDPHLVVNVATHYGTPVGFCAHVVHTDENGLPYITILKVAVKPAYRRKRIATHFVDNIKQYVPNNAEGRIMAYVPESFCRPGTPECVLPFLKAAGFKGQGVEPAMFNSYGDFEDGYLFTL